MRALMTILLFLTALPLAACGGGGDPPPAATPGRRVEAVPETDRLYSGDRTQMDSLMVVINDAESLQLWWQRATASAEPRQPVPAIDFAQNTVLLVSGGRMNNGDRIRVDSLGFEVQAEPGGGRREVWFAVVRAILDCNPLPGVRYPLEFVRIAKVAAIRFDPRASVCPAREALE